MSRRPLFLVLVLFCSAGEAQDGKKEARPAWTSTLKCLAPLAREARSGAAPLTMKQAFFDGPFSSPAYQSSDSSPAPVRLSQGFTRLIQFDDREADRFFRSCLSDEKTACAALLGLAQSNADDSRRATCFLDEAAAKTGNDEVLLEWHAHLAASMSSAQTPPGIADWRDLALSTKRPEIAISLARHLVISAMGGAAADSTIDYLKELTEVSPLLKELPLLQPEPDLSHAGTASPQWTRLLAENEIAAGRTREGIDLLVRSIEAEQRRLTDTHQVMPEATLSMGDTARRLLRLLILHGHQEEAEDIARSLLELPRDLFSVGKRWRRLDRDATPWVVARHTLAEILITNQDWESLTSLPRGFSSRDKAEWFLWQMIAAQESGADSNLWLAALRRERDGSDLLEGAENFLQWKQEGELLEPLAFPGVPSHFLISSFPDRLPKLESLEMNPVVDAVKRPAPAFSLPDWQQEEISLPDYEGGPVLIIFFLGGGCLHCVEQLTAFGPWASRFEDAGVPILAVSTDPVEILSETLSGEVKIESAFPIPIVSDHELKAFKEWGVFDDFDQRAIHGTFLLNASSEIIWMETGNAPYMHPDYLLHETKRLLSQP